MLPRLRLLTIRSAVVEEDLSERSGSIGYNDRVLVAFACAAAEELVGVLHCFYCSYIKAWS